MAQLEVQAVHGLEWIRLLIDKNKEQLVFHLRQDAFGAATDLPLAYLACDGLVRGIEGRIGGENAGNNRTNSSCVSPVAARNSRGLACKVV